MADPSATEGVILPKAGQRNILITSALPYVNNVPHLGNIIGSVLSADVFSRYCKGRGINTLFVCGTDEYGTTTEAKALIDNTTPQELCDKYYKIHADIYKWFNIEFDIFGRTTTKQQTEITQDIFLKLNQNNFLTELVTTQLYCEEHKSFLADRFVEGECPYCAYEDARGDQCDRCGQVVDSLDLKRPRCKIDGATPVHRETKHVFLELDKLQPEIESFFLKSSVKGIWSKNGIDITAAWLKKGLLARSITRDIKWGTAVPLPGYEDKVIYAWFDACIGYVSITACYTTQWERWWHNPDDVELFQFMGKDNVPFHTVIFPASQIGTRQTWTKLHHLSATEYLTYEGGKFSKSRGIGVFGNEAQLTGVPADVWRYYLLSVRPESGDSEFNWDSLISANNNVLLKNLGNYVSRVIKFLNSKHYNGIVPSYRDFDEPSLSEWKEEVNQLLAQYNQELAVAKLRAGLATVLQISQLGNGFLQTNGLSNKLAEENPAKCAAVVGLAVNLIHLLSALIAPYMPETARGMNEQLGAASLQIPEQWSADTIPAGHVVGKAAYLFSNIKVEKAEEWRRKFGGDGFQEAKKKDVVEKQVKKESKKKTVLPASET